MIAPHRISFVGLGIMGSLMAKNLVRAGFDIGVHDTDASVLAKKPFRLLRGVQYDHDQQQVVFLSLPNSTAVETLLHSSLTRLARGSIVIDTSTTTPGTAALCASILTPLNIHFLDSPVTGEEKRAEEGSLTFITSGNREAYDSITPLLRHMGSQLIHISEEHGKAQLTKALNNALYNVSVVAMAEVLTLARESGITPEVFVEVVRTGSGSSFGFNKFAPLCLRGQYAAPQHGYALGKAYKDMEVTHGAQEAISPQLQLPLLEACSETYRRGLSDPDLRLGGQAKGALIRLYEKDLQALRTEQQQQEEKQQEEEGENLTRPAADPHEA